MLNKGDKIVAKKDIFGIIREGDVCEILNSKNDMVSFKSEDGDYKGLMSLTEFEECFDKLEMEKETNNDVYTGCKEYIYDSLDEILNKSEFDIYTVFDKCVVVSCKLPNGLVITESHSFANYDDYDEETGIDFCMNKIEYKVLELENYLSLNNKHENNNDVFLN